MADRLEEIRQKFDIPAELLQVEITETASTEDYRTFQKVVDSIRAKGFRVAIDDFGVAYANLMTLARLGFDELRMCIRDRRGPHPFRPCPSRQSHAVTDP